MPREQEDPLIALKERLAEFSEKLVELDEMAAKHVYHNPNFSLIDARQHRMILHYYLYKAEDLALDFEILKRDEETATFIALIDGQIRRLRKIFEEWHGDPEGDAGIPDSFKEAMQDMRAGRTFDMEVDMFATNAPSDA